MYDYNEAMRLVELNIAAQLDPKQMEIEYDALDFGCRSADNDEFDKAVIRSSPVVKLQDSF